MTAAASDSGSKRNSNAAPANSAATTADTQQQYAALHDSSDDEMPIPMKLSALTKALLGDGASAAEAAEAVAEGKGAVTRRRSALNRSTSSAAGLDTDSNSQIQSQQQDRTSVRQTRRHVRAGSVQASGGAPSSASRPASPPGLLSRDSSPAPRKRVVRLSSTTPAGGMGPAPVPLRRSVSTLKHSTNRRSTTTEDKGADLLAPSIAPAPIDTALPVAPASSSAANLAEANSTPASSVRRVQIAVGSSGGRSASRATRLSSSSSLSALRATHGTEYSADHHSDAEQAPSYDEPPSTIARTSSQPQQVHSVLYSYGIGSGSSAGAISRSGSRDVESQQALQSSVRVKRVGKTLGGGFASGPARRGRRRTSDEDGEGNNHDDVLQSRQDSDAGGLYAPSQEADAGALYHKDVHESNSRSPFFDLYGPSERAATGSPVSGRNLSAQRATSLRNLSSRAEHLQPQQLDQQQLVQPEHVPLGEQQRDLPRRRSYRSDILPPAPPPEAAPPAPPAPPVSSSRPRLPSAHDRENDLAYVGLSVKPLVVGGAEKEYNVNRIRPLRSALQPAEANAKLLPMLSAKSAGIGAANVSPQRKALSTISRNTPHRVAPPPPPKMSVLETATGAPAGAAATAQAGKKPRILLKVNGRSYQRVDCVGRGGSGKVYKVTAENGKMFAMKRVSLENTDESTIRGFMGEIDLLKKLSGVERVIQLFDFEMNNEKHMLSLVSLKMHKILILFPCCSTN